MIELVSRSPEMKRAPRSEFLAKLEARWDKVGLLCVGLDSDYDKLTSSIKLRYPYNAGDAVLEFNKQIIDATSDLVCAYKPQYAFYGALGVLGVTALRKTIQYIHDEHPDIPVILDAKRGDIGNTAEQYAKEVFDWYGADAVTVNPYLGYDAVEPFLKRRDKGVIILARTSNPSAKDFEDVVDKETGLPLFQLVALKAAKEWNKNGNIGLVMGATYPQEMKIVRDLVGPDIPFLVPGLGAQGGKAEDLPNGFNDRGTGIIANAARGVIFASSGPDFAKAARASAQKLRDEINRYR